MQDVNCSKQEQVQNVYYFVVSPHFGVVIQAREIQFFLANLVDMLEHM